MGTGTTAVVAKRFKRHFCGAEISPEYAAIADQRISGLPDANNNFPNLKTLRDFVRTNNVTDISKFTFSRQRKNSIPSLETRAYPEEHHIVEIIDRIEYEAENSNYKILIKNS